MLNTHLRLNLGQLISRCHALPGVHQYLFCSGCERASLWFFAQLRPPVPAGGSSRLQGRFTDMIRLRQVPADASLMLALPLHWARGLPVRAAAPPLRELAAAGGACVGLHHLTGASDSRADQSVSADADQPVSELGRLWLHYREFSTRPLTSAEAVRQLRLERLLQRRFAPGSLEPSRRGQPLPLHRWLSGLPQNPDGLARDLVALLHLLPPRSQAAVAEALAERILAALDDSSTDPGPWRGLLEALVGGINTRDSRLSDLAHHLRAYGLRRAEAFADPAERGLMLMRLLQAGPELTAVSPDGLAHCIDALVQAGQQQSLEEIVSAAGPNLLLLRSLVLALHPDTCHRLPSLQSPSCCLLLLKGVLLLDTTCVSGLDGVRRKALVALADGALARIFWQRPLLLRLLHDLRRFPLELGWLWNRSALLRGLEWLHGQAVATSPQPVDPGTAPWPDERGIDHMLRSQVLLLLRMMPHCDERAGLLRVVAAAGKPPQQRLLDRGDEEALVFAAAAGLAERSVALVRIAAERSGVPELLPPSLPPAPVEQAFPAILEHWGHCFGAEAGREHAPIAVVITTHAPQLSLLRLSLQSLALQTLWPREVWVVDDGSPPAIAADLANLVETCRAGLGLPLRLVQRSDNQGQYACRNLALAMLSADAMAIQDDDDLSHPLRLALQWRALQRGCAGVYARHLRLDQDDAAPQVDGEEGRFFGDGITTLMVSTAAARALGGFYPVRSRGDVEFRGRLERRYGDRQIIRLEQPLYLMRGAATTISSGFEYGCSISLPTWRRLMGREVLL